MFTCYSAHYKFIFVGGLTIRPDCVVVTMVLLSLALVTGGSVGSGGDDGGGVLWWLACVALDLVNLLVCFNSGSGKGVFGMKGSSESRTSTLFWLIIFPVFLW